MSLELESTQDLINEIGKRHTTAVVLLDGNTENKRYFIAGNYYSAIGLLHTAKEYLTLMCLHNTRGPDG